MLLRQDQGVKLSCCNGLHFMNSILVYYSLTTTTIFNLSISSQQPKLTPWSCLNNMNYTLGTHQKDTIYSAKAVSTTKNKYSISSEQILMTEIFGVLFPSFGSHFL